MKTSARQPRLVLFALLLTPLATLGAVAAEAPFTIEPARPNTVTFDSVSASFVRMTIRGKGAGQPCIDELEIYGPESDKNLALAAAGAKATASSCLEGYAAHAVAHLNDGQYGNARSWIPAEDSGWAQIELPQPATVNRVVFSRDREGHYKDRLPAALEIQVSDDGQAWQTVRKIEIARVVLAEPTYMATNEPITLEFPPCQARHVRLAINKTSGGQPCIDELELYGPDSDQNLALASAGAKASASSCLEGHAIHRIEHLNDGQGGNDRSWIAAEASGWAQIELPATATVQRARLRSRSQGPPQRPPARRTSRSASRWTASTGHWSRRPWGWRACARAAGAGRKRATLGRSAWCRRCPPLGARGFRIASTPPATSRTCASCSNSSSSNASCGPSARVWLWSSTPRPCAARWPIWRPRIRTASRRRDLPSSWRPTSSNCPSWRRCSRAAGPDQLRQAVDLGRPMIAFQRQAAAGQPAAGFRGTPGARPQAAGRGPRRHVLALGAAVRHDGQLVVRLPAQEPARGAVVARPDRRLPAERSPPAAQHGAGRRRGPPRADDLQGRPTATCSSTPSCTSTPTG